MLLDNPPTTLDGWVHKAIAVDSNYRMTMEVWGGKPTAEERPDVTIFLLSHLHTFSSHRTVASPPPHFIVSIDSAVCFTIMLFTYTCLLFVFRRMHFIHAYLLLIYYMPCKHGLFVYKLSVDLAVSLASL